ncbi:MAG: guanylate kinase [Kangiellaceae bacterium]|nr:guanylate kinase [Kangiellaceae bacterium]
MEQATANLFVVSAPSGAGKTSLLKQLISELESVQTSISHTTRTKREAEVDGVDYHFVNSETFKALIDEGAFYENAEVFGNCYGTSKSSIADQLAKGIDVILEIDWQGARQIREQLPHSKSVFILPPSKAELENRLQGRGQDDDSVIKGRMDAAISEMSHFNEYDYLVINDDFSSAVAEIKAIILAERQKLPVQRKKHAHLLSNLLE